MKMILVIASVLLVAVNSVHGQCTEVPNCSTCENRGPECISCPAAKVLSSDKQSCLDCPTNCAKCELKNDNDELTCLECSSGYLKDGECADCELDNCMTCTVEGDVETCTKCDDPGYSLSGGKCNGCPTGKYLDGTSCKTCPTNSVSCTTGPTVTACKNEGVSYVKAEDAKSCLACTGCVKCALEDSAAKCTECKENEYLNEGSCDLCAGDSTSDDNCKTCGDDGVCTECNKKYYLKDGECANCPANCDECSENDSGETICGTCSVNYGLNEELICDKCPSKCKVCDDNGVCSECMGDADTGVNKDGVVICYDLPTGCTDLETTAASTDTTKSFPQCKSDGCDTGYGFDDTDNQCKACDGDGGVVGCAICSISGGTITCDADSGSGDSAVYGCKTGYAQWDDSSVKKCALCNQVDNCVECTASDATTITCTACASGYGTSGSGADTVCTACDSEGGVDGCAICTIAGDGGITCDADSGSGDSAVYGCKDGYGQWDDSGAKKCALCNQVTNCKACTASDATTITCTTCEEGYITDGSGSATTCVECDLSNCVTCTIVDSAPSCSACKTGYRIKDGKCTKCTGNCDACDTDAEGNQECTDCADNFKIVDGACEACPTNCLNCDTEPCNECEAGYGLTEDGSSCVACISNCEDCDASADKKCTKCSDEYYPLEDKCVDCPSSCLECSYDDGVMLCGKCADGYVLNGGKCDKCPSNCQECSSATKCKTGKCNAGYAVEANECQACATLTGIANCALCSEKPDANSSAPCLACNAGYALKDNLQSGDGAECVQYTLNCQGGAIADRPFQCDEGKCTGETTQTDDNLCARECYVCGDYDNDEFVAAEDCKADNTSGVVTLCPSGYCAMKGRKVDGKNVVAGGCLPVTDTCPSSDVDCKSINEGEEQLTQCTKCCDSNLCLQGDLTTGLEEGNLAPANSANLLMLVSCSIGTLALLLSRA